MRYYNLAKRFALVTLGLGTLALLVYCYQLNGVVTEAFEGRRFKIPAKVYARPLELFAQKLATKAEVTYELQALKYKAVSEVTQPGQYHHTGNHFTIFSRSFKFWDGHQKAMAFKFSISQGKIRNLTDTHNKKLPIARLEPLAIAGIYPTKKENRELVSLEVVPPHLIEALIATEDQRYYSHHGVDPRGVLRALSQLFSGSRIQGASTITQQLVKNFFLTPERTLKRKFKEILMAIIIDARFSKADILQTYLNEVYLGQDLKFGIHGVGLASRFYFGKPVSEISTEQSALLVALLKGPSVYNPRRFPERAKVRRDLVLKLMLQQNRITPDAYEEATQRALNVVEQPNLSKTAYPDFLGLVLKQLKNDYRREDLTQEGLKIFTTLNPFIQNAAETSLVNKINQLTQKNNQGDTLQGAVIVSESQTGEVCAVVGSKTPRFPGFNRAIDASRQTGSLIKPALYLTALSHPDQFNLATDLSDTAFVWEQAGAPPWRPQNYNKKYHGNVPLWMALANSYNVAAARLGATIGIPEVVKTLKNMGVERNITPYPSTVLGSLELSPLEVAQMYQTLASDGFLSPFRAIRSITQQTGEPLERYHWKIKQTLSPQSTYLTTRALQLVVEKGTAKSIDKALHRLHPAGKTGTTDNLRDSWFAGFTGSHVGVVWLGNDSNSSTGLTGASGALPIWAAIMNQLSTQPLKPQKPDGIEFRSTRFSDWKVSRSACSQSIKLPFMRGESSQRKTHCGKTLRSNGAKSWLKNLFHR